MDSISPPLNLDWLYYILWPVEYGRSDAVLVLCISLKRPGTFPLSLSTPAFAIRPGELLEDEGPCGVDQNIPSGGSCRPANLPVG